MFEHVSIMFKSVQTMFKHVQTMFEHVSIMFKSAQTMFKHVWAAGGMGQLGQVWGDGARPRAPPDINILYKNPLGPS